MTLALFLGITNKKLFEVRRYFLILVVITGACIASKKAKRVDRQIEQVVETARSYTGTPYRYGGTSRQGMDCSGLLCASFRSAGLDLPRTSAAQSKMGKAVTIHNLKPGDLVFFRARKGWGKISHVGMITDVRSTRDIRFIHSSTKLGVVENNLLSDYYRRVFVKARRPF